MTPETDQEKILIAGAAVSGSLIQFNYIREKLKLGKSLLVFVTGIACGIYGGTYIASIIPGCSRELMLIIVAVTAVVGRVLLRAVFQVAEKRAPAFLEGKIDAIEEKIHSRKEDKEAEDKDNG
jgi:hypothetical protein